MNPDTMEIIKDAVGLVSLVALFYIGWLCVAVFG